MQPTIQSSVICFRITDNQMLFPKINTRYRTNIQTLPNFKMRILHLGNKTNIS